MPPTTRRQARLASEERVQRAHEREAEILRRNGFFMHVVFDDKDTPWGKNIHTHGLELYDKHPDFQVVAPVPDRTAVEICQRLGDRVKGGERFEYGRRYRGVIDGGYDVTFARAWEGGRQVMRVIVADRDNNVELGKITGTLARQYEDCIESATTRK